MPFGAKANGMVEAGKPGPPHRRIRRGAAPIIGVSLALCPLGSGAQDAMAMPQCSGTPEAEGHSQFFALCDALQTALSEAGGAPILRISAITPTLVVLRVSDPRGGNRPPTDLHLGLTDTTLSPTHYSQLAASLVSAARHLGLLPAD